VINTASDVVKAEGEDPANPGCLREEGARRSFSDFSGDSQSWVRTPCQRLALDETQETYFCKAKPQKKSSQNPENALFDALLILDFQK